MKWRTGISSSQWVGSQERGDSMVEYDSEADLLNHIRDGAFGTPINLKTGPDDIEVTVIACELIGTIRADWTCKACNGEGCIKCNDGWEQGEDRFVTEYRGRYVLAVTRYFVKEED